MFDFNYRKLPVIGAVGFMVLGVYWLSHSFTSAEPKIEPVSFTYEMPRPKSYSDEFDISGRPIVRKIKTIGGKTQLPPSVAAPVAGRGPQTPADKKKEDAKKAKKTAQKKKAKLGVKVVDSGRDKMKAVAAATPENSVEAYNYQDMTPAVNNEPPVAEKKVSEAEWRQRFVADPTLRTAQAFVQAFRQEKVEAAFFYSLSEELLLDTEPRRQQAGLFLLKSAPSMRAFEILAIHRDSFEDPFKAKVTLALRSYGEAGYFGVLSRAFNHGDVNVVRVAVQVLTSTVQAQNAGAQGGRPIGGEIERGPGSTPIAPSAFQVFLTPLSQYQGDDEALAQQIAQLLSQIQSLLQA